MSCLVAVVVTVAFVQPHMVPPSCMLPSSSHVAIVMGQVIVAIAIMVVVWSSYGLRHHNRQAATVREKSEG